MVKADAPYQEKDVRVLSMIYRSVCTHDLRYDAPFWSSCTSHAVQFCELAHDLGENMCIGQLSCSM